MARQFAESEEGKADDPFGQSMRAIDGNNAKGWGECRSPKAFEVGRVVNCKALYGCIFFEKGEFELAAK